MSVEQPSEPPAADASAWNDPRLRSARLFGKVHRLFARRLDEELAESGLRFAQAPVLAALQDGTPRPQKDLARIAEVEQASMAQILARMERDGLIQRERDPKDGRSTLISLTAAAHARLPAAREAMRRAGRRALAAFDKRELRELTRLLERIIENLDAA